MLLDMLEDTGKTEAGTERHEKQYGKALVSSGTVMTHKNGNSTKPRRYGAN